MYNRTVTSTLNSLKKIYVLTPPGIKLKFARELSVNISIDMQIAYLKLDW